jgi:endoribonuclease Dicer
MFTFSSVLRLEKYPMVFSASSSHNNVVVVPMRQGSPPTIDWTFLSHISTLATRRLRSLSDSERAGFSFEASDYKDAVIMPWYRNQDQPQYFYVAEICPHLNPASDFPGEGFETFSKYYSTKYSINIQNCTQPLLDVDHTSARLNFLTPRYVNRKGIALPTSSEETKRNKRENLDQKQILVPELCAVHPFPAGLWRQAVSLPCALYRLNGLLISDQIRRVVALEMRLGVATLPRDFQWPALNFGWTLKDVVSLKSDEKVDRKEKSVTRNRGGNKKEEMGEFGEWDESLTDGEDMERVAETLIHKLAEEERSNRKKKIGNRNLE